MKKIKILAVNDLMFTLKLLELEVKESGLPIEIYEAINGDKAVQKIEKGEEYDAILMNLEMPFMDGWMATKKIRAMGVSTPIIAWSVHIKKFFIESCIKVGMDDYIEIDGSKLLKDVLKALDRVEVMVSENRDILS